MFGNSYKKREILSNGVDKCEVYCHNKSMFYIGRFLQRTKTKQAAMNGIKLILEILAENRRVVRAGRRRGATSPGSFRAERVFVGADVVQR